MLKKSQFIVVLSSLCSLNINTMENKKVDAPPGLKKISALAYLSCINDLPNINKQIESETIPEELKDYLFDMNFKDLTEEIVSSEFKTAHKEILFNILKGESINRNFLENLTWLSLYEAVSLYNQKNLGSVVSLYHKSQSQISQAILSNFAQEVQNYIFQFLLKNIAEPLNYKHIINLLLNNWIDYSTDFDLGLKLAAKHGNLKTVTKLFDLATPEAQNMALIGAAQYGHEEIIRFLLENNIDVHSENNCALFWAIKGRFLSTIAILIENGATINEKMNEELNFQQQLGDLIAKNLKVNCLTVSELINFALLPETQELIKNGAAKKIGLINLMESSKQENN